MLGRMEKRIGDFGPDELLSLARSKSLNELTALKVLRNPYCTAEIAEKVADQRHVLASHTVRQLVCEIRGFPFARTVSLLATLPWLSLLELAGAPKTPPVVRKYAERKLLMKLPSMALGEKVAMARRCQRSFFKALITTSDDLILTALLNNSRLVENDILIMLNTLSVSANLCREIAAHEKWGQYRGVRKALVVCPHTPEILAFSLLAFMNNRDLEGLSVRPDVSERVKDSAKALMEKRKSR